MSTTVTYNRVHPGDPDTVDWNGMSFKHGEAVEMDGRRKDHKPFIEAAEGNPWFSVNGENSDADTGGGSRSPKKREVDSPETYRAYAIDWINKAGTLSALETRWNKEAELRDQVGWGSDDQHLIAPILDPKLENLRRQEG